MLLNNKITKLQKKILGLKIMKKICAVENKNQQSTALQMFLMLKKKRLDNEERDFTKIYM